MTMCVLQATLPPPLTPWLNARERLATALQRIMPEDFFARHAQPSGFIGHLQPLARMWPTLSRWPAVGALLAGIAGTYCLVCLMFSQVRSEGLLLCLHDQWWPCVSGRVWHAGHVAVC